MIDTFVMKQLMKLLHAPICIYDQAGNVVQEFEKLEGKKIIEKSDFVPDFQNGIHIVGVHYRGHIEFLSDVADQTVYQNGSIGIQA